MQRTSLNVERSFPKGIERRRDLLVRTYAALATDSGKRLTSHV